MSCTEVKEIKEEEEELETKKTTLELNVKIRVDQMDLTPKRYANELRKLENLTKNTSIYYLLRKLANIIETKELI